MKKEKLYSMERTGKRMNESFNITDDRAIELIMRTLNSFEDYVNGDLTFGQFAATAVNYDDLLTNEKCFLICHCTLKAQAFEFRSYIEAGDIALLLKRLYFY